MYREQARYLERIYKWAKRVGVAEIRRQILDDPERRKVLFDRFVFSQKFAQVDPWAERAGGLHRHEYRPLATAGMAEAAE
jgi:nitrite reductase (NADH) large subunit